MGAGAGLRLSSDLRAGASLSPRSKRYDPGGDYHEVASLVHHVLDLNYIGKLASVIMRAVERDMDPEALDILRPLLIMGGAMVLVMLCRELHKGWMETVTIRKMRQRAQDRQRVTREEKETDQE